MRIVTTSTLVGQYGGKMRAVAPGIEFTEIGQDGAFSGPVADAEVAVLSTDMFRHGLHMHLIRALPEMTALKWLHLFFVGVDHPAFQQVGGRGVTVTNSPGVTAVPIAQYVLATMLRHARRLPAFEAAMQDKAWRRADCEELTGRTVAVIGAGGIGGEVARLCGAFGMRVLGSRRTPGDQPNFDAIYPPDRLHDLLREADYVVLACPLTSQTRGLLDTEAFSVMKDGAYLVNVARGPIIVDDALIDALQSGKLSGAALDVFEPEPLPADSPFWSMPNVLVTPHASSFSPLTMDRAANLFIENLRCYAADAPMRGVVDWDDVASE